MHFCLRWNYWTIHHFSVHSNAVNPMDLPWMVTSGWSDNQNSDRDSSIWLCHCTGHITSPDHVISSYHVTWKQDLSIRQSWNHKCEKCRVKCWILWVQEVLIHTVDGYFYIVVGHCNIQLTHLWRHKLAPTLIKKRNVLLADVQSSGTQQRVHKLSCKHDRDDKT